MPPLPRAVAAAPDLGPGGSAPDGGGGGGPIDHSSRQGFINSMLPYAKAAEARTGLPAEMMIAINLNEQGWQNPAPGNNYFGIKGSNPQTGANTGPEETWEDYGQGRVNTTDVFRAYDSPADSYADFGNFLQSNSRYGPALAEFAQTHDRRALAQNLNRAGYATDPNWANQINSIADSISGGGGAPGAPTPPLPPGATTHSAALPFDLSLVPPPQNLQTSADHLLPRDAGTPAEQALRSLGLGPGTSGATPPPPNPPAPTPPASPYGPYGPTDQSDPGYPGNAPAPAFLPAGLDPTTVDALAAGAAQPQQVTGVDPLSGAPIYGGGTAGLIPPSVIQSAAATLGQLPQAALDAVSRPPAPAPTAPLPPPSSPGPYGPTDRSDAGYPGNAPPPPGSGGALTPAELDALVEHALQNPPSGGAGNTDAPYTPGQPLPFSTSGERTAAAVVGGAALAALTAPASLPAALLTGGLTGLAVAGGLDTMLNRAQGQPDQPGPGMAGYGADPSATPHVTLFGRSFAILPEQGSPLDTVLLAAGPALGAGPAAVPYLPATTKVGAALDVVKQMAAGVIGQNYEPVDLGLGAAGRAQAAAARQGMTWPDVVSALRQATQDAAPGPRQYQLDRALADVETAYGQAQAAQEAAQTASRANNPALAESWLAQAAELQAGAQRTLFQSTPGMADEWYRVQRQIDGIESILSRRGVDVNRLVDPQDPQAAALLASGQGYQPMPEGLAALYRQRQGVSDAFAQVGLPRLFNRDLFESDLVTQFGLPPEQAHAVVTATDAHAQAWAALAPGRQPQDWYADHVLKIVAEQGPEALAPEAVLRGSLEAPGASSFAPTGEAPKEEAGAAVLGGSREEAAPAPEPVAAAGAREAREAPPPAAATERPPTPAEPVPAPPPADRAELERQYLAAYHDPTPGSYGRAVALGEELKAQHGLTNADLNALNRRANAESVPLTAAPTGPPLRFGPRSLAVVATREDFYAAVADRHVAEERGDAPEAIAALQDRVDVTRAAYVQAQQAERAGGATGTLMQAAGELPDELAARRLGMPPALHHDLSLLAEERAWTHAVTTPGELVALPAELSHGAEVGRVVQGAADPAHGGVNGKVLVEHELDGATVQRWYDALQLDAYHEPNAEPNAAPAPGPGGLRLLQGQADPAAKGAVTFLNDGKAIIHAFESADFSTITHELFHIFRRDLPDADLRTAAAWAGAADLRTWSVAAEEKFARGGERYWATGLAPSQALAAVFDQFRQWMGQIYGHITGSAIDVDISPEMRAVFDRLFVPTPEDVSATPNAGAAGNPVGAAGQQRGFARTVERTDDVAAELRALVAQDPNNRYLPITNRETVDAAAAAVQADPTGTLTRLLTQGVRTPEDAAAGFLLMRQHEIAGDYDTAAALAGAVADAGTQAGQFVQALSLWSRLSPEGVLRYAVQAAERGRPEARQAVRLAATPDQALALAAAVRQAAGRFTPAAAAQAVAGAIPGLGSRRITPEQAQAVLAGLWKMVKDLPIGDPAAQAAAMEEVEAGSRLGRATTATGADVHRPYDFRFRVADLDELTPSHLDTLEVNPAYPPELQPRNRQAMSSQAQIAEMAQRLQPSALLYDTRRLDSGSPIVGPDGMVESGNGRILALRRAAQENPDRYDAYRQELAATAADYGLDAATVRGMDHPVLVRERTTPLTDAERPAFARDANARTTLGMGLVEQARSDAALIPDRALLDLQVRPGQSLDAALTAPANQPLVDAFFRALPPDEAAALRNAQGRLARPGLERLEAALFTRVYPGPVGERIAQAFFESLDPTVMNVRQGVLAALPAVARAEGLIRAGARDAELSLSGDLAAAVDMLARVKAQGRTARGFVEQGRLFDRELTPLQEGIMTYLEDIGGSPRRVRNFLDTYAQGVEDAPAAAQGALFQARATGAGVSKLDLLSKAMKSTSEMTTAARGAKAPVELSLEEHIAQAARRREEAAVRQTEREAAQAGVKQARAQERAATLQRQRAENEARRAGPARERALQAEQQRQAKQLVGVATQAKRAREAAEARAHRLQAQETERQARLRQQEAQTRQRQADADRKTTLREQQRSATAQDRADRRTEAATLQRGGNQARRDAAAAQADAQRAGRASQAAAQQEARAQARARGEFAPSALTPENAQRLLQKAATQYGPPHPLAPEKAAALLAQSRSLALLPDGRERVLATARLMRDIAELTPAGLGQQSATLLSVAQLGNLPTLLKNVASHAVLALTENLSRAAGLVPDVAASFVSGQRALGGPHPLAELRGWVQGAREGAEEVRQGVKIRRQPGLVERYGGGRTFRTAAADALAPGLSPLERARRMVATVPYYGEMGLRWGLEPQINAFLQAGIDGALQDLAQVQAYNEGLRGPAAGVRAAQLLLAPTPEMDQLAYAEGLQRVFSNERAVSSMAVGLKELLNRLGLGKTVAGSQVKATHAFGLGNIVINYPRVPTNIALTAIDYSPFGFLLALPDLVRTLAPAAATGLTRAERLAAQRRLSLALGRAVVGTAGYTAVGYVLGNLGILHGARNPDAAIANVEQAEGRGPNSLNLSALQRWVTGGLDPQAARARPGDTVLSLANLEPAAGGLAAGAALGQGVTTVKSLRATPGGASAADWWGQFFDTASTAGQTLLLGLNVYGGSLPMFTAAQQLGGGRRALAAGGGAAQAAADGVVTMLQDAPASFVPALLYDVTKQLDNTPRETRTGAFWGDLQARLFARIPILSATLPAQVGPWGEDAQRTQGRANPWDSFVNPMPATSYLPTPAAELVQRLYQATGAKGVYPKVIPDTVQVTDDRGAPVAVPLLPAEKADYSRFIGQTTAQLMGELAQSPDFQRADPQQQAALLEETLGRVDSAAKGWVIQKSQDGAFALPGGVSALPDAVARTRPQQEADDAALARFRAGQPNGMSGPQWVKAEQARSAGLRAALTSRADLEAPGSEAAAAAALQRAILAQLPANTAGAARGSLLAAGYRAMPMPSDPEGQPDFAAYRREQQSFRGALPPADQALLDASLQKGLTPTQAEWQKAQETLRPYFDADQDLAQQYPAFAKVLPSVAEYKRLFPQKPLLQALLVQAHTNPHDPQVLAFEQNQGASVPWLYGELQKDEALYGDYSKVMTQAHDQLRQQNPALDQAGKFWLGWGPLGFPKKVG